MLLCFYFSRQDQANLQKAIDNSSAPTRSRTPSPPISNTNTETINEDAAQIQLNNQDFPTLRGSIENLHIKPTMSKAPGRNIHSLDDFPSLGNGPQPARAPPPGFGNIGKETSIITKPKNPPPGFKKQSPPIQKKTEPPKPSFKTQTSNESSVIRKAVPVPSKGTEMPKKEIQTASKNNASRNQSFIEDVKLFLGHDKEKFAEFKTLSGKFRQGRCSAQEYYTNCTMLFGCNFNYIFNELVSLLPDPDKQTELLAVHNDSKAVAKQNGKTVQSNGVKQPSPQLAWGPTPASQPKQVKPVKQDPKTRHEADFPSLPLAGPRQIKAINIYRPTNTQPMKSAWVRGK